MTEMIALDAMDELTAARDFVDLLEMAVRYSPEQEAKALSAGCFAALDQIERTRELLTKLGEA